MPTTRIAELASIIETNTSQIDKYLSSQGLPSPSFDADVPPGLLLDSHITACHQAVLEATDELHSQMLGHVKVLTNPVHDMFVSLQVIQRFKIATSFPQDKNERSYSELSELCGLAEYDTRRILRHAITRHIFQGPRPGVVAHTAASKVLVNNPLMGEWIGMVFDDMWPAATRVRDRLEADAADFLSKGYNIAENTQEPLFAELAKQPDRAQRFAAAMSLFTVGLSSGLVVDIGGSRGYVSIAIAKQFPSLRCIVQDRKEVVTNGPAKVPLELGDRVTFMEHDFFTEQPVKGADVYYFRWIFHDWSDKYCALILGCLIPALKHGSKIVINDMILPEPGLVSLYQEAELRAYDLIMQAVQNAKERDASDWVNLFQDADPRFRFLGVMQPPMSKLGIIEVSWNGD